MGITSNYDCDELDRLRQRHQKVLRRIQQYEIEAGTLRAQLAARDERVAALEQKIVRMSLELASSRAFEDAHRSTQRTSHSEWSDWNKTVDGGASPPAPADIGTSTRDERVAALEEKIVHMSLELACSLATEDAHCSTRRTSNSVHGDRDEKGGDGDVLSLALSDVVTRRRHQVGRCRSVSSVPGDAALYFGSSAAAAPIPKPRENVFRNSISCEKFLRGSLPWSFGSTNCEDAGDPTLDDETEASSAPSSIDGPCSGGPAAGFGNLFRKNRPSRHRRSSHDEGAVLLSKEREGAFLNQDRNKQKNNCQEPGAFRRRQRRRTEESQMDTSLVSLEGVVFPSSFEDIVSKGCLDLRGRSSC